MLLLLGFWLVDLTQFQDANIIGVQDVASAIDDMLDQIANKMPGNIFSVNCFKGHYFVQFANPFSSFYWQVEW